MDRPQNKQINDQHHGRLRPHLCTAAMFACLSLILQVAAFPQDNQHDVPAPLKPWKNWVLRDHGHANCPTPYDDSQQHICFWPAELSLSATQNGASWQLKVRAFEKTWVPLPGGAQNWPIEVRADDQVLPVVARDGSPSIQLGPGSHNVSGSFRWVVIPQQLKIPTQIGVLNLIVDAQAVPTPNWDSSGNVWLKRSKVEAEDKDFLSSKIYRVIEDGIPIWLRTEIELTVAGKSREENLGWILPQGWELSMVDSPLPVAVDDAGKMKAQVRAGKWKVYLHAFRNSDIDEVQFDAAARPVTDTELVGFRAMPDLRVAEITGIQPIDVNQTTFPDQWRDLPVYQWNTAESFRLIEKMRGMGERAPQGLTIERQFWLDEDGKGITFRDGITGALQQIWRLDVAKGLELGAVRIDGEGQLITTNPVTGDQGTELRDRNLNMTAVGRIDQSGEFAATGWQADAKDLRLTIHLPPGWRVFAVMGADTVTGDWLTAWSLLDLFLLLIFSLAVFRLWGVKAGIVAFLAFGLIYHEPGAPRSIWLFLLMPMALLRVVKDGAGKRWLGIWKFLAVALLVLNVIPFVATQIQSAIYPQLESSGTPYAERGMFRLLGQAYTAGVQVADYARESKAESLESGGFVQSELAQGNLLFDPNAKIQTGPAEPKWSWNRVVCEWSGPVTSTQQIRPIMISRQLHQGLIVLRLLLLVILIAMIFGRLKFRFPFRKSAVAAILLMLISVPSASAQIPDQKMLDKLRERLLQPSDAYPNAAEIAKVELTVKDDGIVMKAEVHAAIDVAVPIPGRLPGWSPVSVTIDDENANVLIRRDGYLWTIIPAGVHEVVVGGLLADTTEWEWTFLLKPRFVSVDAPDWNVTGVRRNGLPEAQVFFSKKQKSSEGEATYDQKNFRAIVAVSRELEIGLVWKIKNIVRRLSEPGKAVSINVPLLQGESVLSSNVLVENQTIQVNLGATQKEFSWVSEIQPTDEITLTAASSEMWVERWELVTSPVWNVAFTGVAPMYEEQESRLIPVWRPWPGETITFGFSRPQAVVGETVTVQQVHHEMTLGQRQRTNQLQLTIESSLGTDFPITLNSNAEISSLTIDGQGSPVRRDGDQLIVPLHPGEQSVDINWAVLEPLGMMSGVGEVRLPAPGANVTTAIVVPENRWILWASGPLRGPAVRFWAILAVSILAAIILGSFSLSPLHRVEWVLLAIGLTQIHVSAAMIVVGWLFLLGWRGQRVPGELARWKFNISQLTIVAITLTAIGILIVVVGEGLLGSPEMSIVGNNSSRTYLQWFSPRAGMDLPLASTISISVWFYRLMMLVWALWLAAALLRWLRTGWNAFSHGGCWKHRAAPTVPTPPTIEIISEP